MYECHHAINNTVFIYFKASVLSGLLRQLLLRQQSSSLSTTTDNFLSCRCLSLAFAPHFTLCPVLLHTTVTVVKL